MKITNYPEATSFDANDILIKDGTNGTKIIKASNAALDFLDMAITAPEMRRNFYRGKSLGTLSADHISAIAAGTFNGLFVGDYWTIGGVNYRIADFDFWYNTGDTAFTKHHAVVVPDASMYSAVMNDTNITTGGYVGSKMYTEGLATARETITAAFGSNLLTHREYLINAVTNGYPSGGGWFDSGIDLMNEIMVCGSYIYTPGSTGSTIPARYTIDKQQLALFRLNPKAVNNRGYIWLRDVVSSTNFATVGNAGYAGCSNASTSLGVRPAFAVGEA